MHNLAYILSVLIIVIWQGTGFSSPEDLEQPKLIITDLDALNELSTSGANLSQILSTPKTLRNDVLSKSLAYQFIVRRVQEDIAEIKKNQKLKYSNLKLDTHYFKPEWLTSSKSSFELVAIVNRFDEVIRHPESCGQLRFIYRLNYQIPNQAPGHPDGSNLPFFINVIFKWRSDDISESSISCETIAKRSFIGSAVTGKILVQTLQDKDSIYRPFLQGQKRVDHIEINYQSLFVLPKASMQVIDSGHYTLHRFKNIEPKSNTQPKLAVVKLENNPDYKKIAHNPALKEKFRTWITSADNLADIDRGVMQIPNEFLSDKATSVSSFGLSREANRPVASLFAAKDFDGVDWGRFQLVKSPAALMRRLDTLSCIGCHQSRSVAGFHVVGEQRKQTSSPYTVAYPLSAHMQDVQTYRSKVITSFAGGDDNRDKFFIPPSERPIDKPGRLGDPCGTGSDPGFNKWTCNDGLQCSAEFLSSRWSEVGECVTAELKQNRIAAIGEQCDQSELKTDQNGAADRIIKKGEIQCTTGKNGICATSLHGFPGGLCSALCEHGTNSSACVATPILGSFSACLDRTNDFKECLARHSVKSFFPRCQSSHDCRSDYICVEEPNDEHICVPPYFLPSFSIRHHLVPK